MLWSERGISLGFSWKGWKSPCEKVLQRCKRCLSIAAGLLSLAMKVVYLGEWQTANLRLLSQVEGREGAKKGGFDFFVVCELQLCVRLR